ncbi:uncharacterized protein CXorf65 homolog [Heptranchias perlo]|uniref:uncharacterized protein CXorf65 homolog n=1 Tax=Heptranchias perlo TaxID=212740 RepID=UPI0035594C07
MYMFTTDNEHGLFNTYCKTLILLDCIKQNCHLETEGEVDLSDESGLVKNLLQNQHCYASDILTEREVYVLVGVNKPASSSTSVYVPLLNNDTIVNSKFLAKLGVRLDSRNESRVKAKKPLKKSASPSPSLSSTTDGKQSTSPHGGRKHTPTPRSGKH